MAESIAKPLIKSGLFRIFMFFFIIALSADLFVCWKVFGGFSVTIKSIADGDDAGDKDKAEQVINGQDLLVTPDYEKSMKEFQELAKQGLGDGPNTAIMHWNDGKNTSSDTQTPADDNTAVDADNTASADNTVNTDNQEASDPSTNQATSNDKKETTLF